MAGQLWASEDVERFRYGPLHKKLMLYANNMGPSLRATMSIISCFRKYSWLVINWSFYPWMELRTRHYFCPDQNTTSFKYLGFQTTPDLLDYCRLTIAHFVFYFRDKVKVWLWYKFWLSLACRADILKAVFIPQLLYFLNN